MPQRQRPRVTSVLIMASVLVLGLSSPLAAVDQHLGGPDAGTTFLDPAMSDQSPAHQEPTCASDGSVLGLSRVVEIDTAGGPEFGSSHHTDTDFLKDGEVVLTFDDGPLRPYTTAVLKALEAHCTKATFFIVGRMAMSDPDMLKRVADAGHTIASHTWSHKNIKSLSGPRGIEEVELGVSAVAKALGRPIAPFFRFPYLSEGKAAIEHIKERDMATFWIDVDSIDYRTKDPAVVHRRVMSQLKQKRKGIILLHDIQRSTAGAMQGLLDDMYAHGFKVVHIVAKDSQSTLAKYDVTIEKRFANKSKASAKANPLADRSFVWSADPAAAKAAPAASKEILPWHRDDAANKPAKSPTKPKPTKSRSEEELPWKMQIFGN